MTGKSVIQKINGYWFAIFIDPFGAHWHHAGMLIYKIFRADEWAALQANGETLGAPVDLADGYVHFSTADQAIETAAKWFAGVQNLQVLACETDGMGDDLKWEPSRVAPCFHICTAPCA